MPASLKPPRSIGSEPVLGKRGFNTRSAYAPLIALFLGVFSNASLAPFMGYFVVEEMRLSPWWLSVYSLLATGITITMNRFVGMRIDRGTRPYAWLALGQAGYTAAVVLLVVAPVPAVVIGFVSLLLGISNTTTATMYSFGRLIMDRSDDSAKANAQLRVITSFAWMVAPPLTFSLASWTSSSNVFHLAALSAFAWVVMGRLLLPIGYRSMPIIATREREKGKVEANMVSAAGVCLCFALAHVLCSTSLPLYYSRELGLPPYAAGVSFSVKCAFEIVAILVSPALVRHFGSRTGLYASAAFAVVALGQFLAASSLSEVMIAATFEGIYYGTFAAVAMTFVQERSPDGIGRATSIYMNSLFMGNMIGVTALGAIATLFDFQAVMVASLVIMVTGLLVLVADHRSAVKGRSS